MRPTWNSTVSMTVVACTAGNFQAIAQRAVELLPQRDGLTVLLDGGTTTGRLATLLPPSVSLVVTNSVPTALQLSEREGPEVWLLGGQVRGITQAVVGASAIDTLTRLLLDHLQQPFALIVAPDPTQGADRRLQAGQRVLDLVGDIGGELFVSVDAVV